MKNVSKETIVRTVLLAVALINQILIVLGINPLPFAEEEIYEIISTIATACAALWTWWKNTSFTPAAITADECLAEIKAEGKAPTEEIGSFAEQTTFNTDDMSELSDEREGV